MKTTEYKKLEIDLYNLFSHLLLDIPLFPLDSHCRITYGLESVYQTFARNYQREEALRKRPMNVYYNSQILASITMQPHKLVELSQYRTDPMRYISKMTERVCRLIAPHVKLKFTLAENEIEMNIRRSARTEITADTMFDSLPNLILDGRGLTTADIWGSYESTRSL